MKLNPALTLPSLNDVLRYLRPRCNYLDENAIFQIDEAIRNNLFYWSAWFDGSINGIVAGEHYGDDIFVSILCADSLEIVKRFVYRFQREYPGKKIYGKRHNKIKRILWVEALQQPNVR